MCDAFQNRGAAKIDGLFHCKVNVTEAITTLFTHLLLQSLRSTVPLHFNANTPKRSVHSRCPKQREMSREEENHVAGVAAGGLSMTNSHRCALRLEGPCYFLNLDFPVPQTVSIRMGFRSWPPCFCTFCVSFVESLRQGCLNATSDPLSSTRKPPGQA